MAREAEKRYARSNQNYVYGNAAPKIDIRREMEDESRIPRVSQTT